MYVSEWREGCVWRRVKRTVAKIANRALIVMHRVNVHKVQRRVFKFSHRIVRKIAVQADAAFETREAVLCVCEQPLLLFCSNVSDVHVLRLLAPGVNKVQHAAIPPRQKRL